MRVFVTGGTGFVGQEVLRQLVAEGHRVRALIREGSEHKLAQHEQVETVPGDVNDAASLESGLADCDAVIHLVGIIREFPSRGVTFERLHVEATRYMLAAAQKQQVARFLHMSANGSREAANTTYHRTKWLAEEAVRASGLAWTIFRPSLIFGRHDQFINMLASQIRMLPAVPVIGDGSYRLSPVAVEDVASGFVRALSNKGSEGESYCCGGTEVLSYDQLLDAVARALGHKPPIKLHHPLWLMQPMIRMLEGISAFPITRDQLAMLLEGNVCDPQPWRDALDISLTPLEQGLDRMLARR